jgi:putative phage-type endonuclease
MNRQLITPADEAEWLQLRTQDLTSTDVAALFGLSPYKTKFELWHEKRAGEVVRIADNDRMKWGRRLESAIAYGIAEDREWTAAPFKDYGRIPAERLGSSFDFQCFARPSSDHFILEVKTVDGLAFQRGWIIEDDYVEAPAHIELQVQHQMLVSGLRRAYIGCLIGGNRIEVLEREADDQVHAGIIAAARDFWSSISEGREPSPVMPDDAEAVIRMNQHAEPGKLIDARGDAVIASLVARYAELGQQAKVIGDERDVVKAELLQAIGDAEKVLLDGFSVSAGVVGPAEVAYTRPGYRNLRITAKKPKAVAA